MCVLISFHSFVCVDEELSVVTVTGVIATLPEVGQRMQICGVFFDVAKNR